MALVRELVRVARPGGRVLVHAWAQEQQQQQQQAGSRTFDFTVAQDVFVPWTLPARFQEPQEHRDPDLKDGQSLPLNQEGDSNGPE